MTAPEDRGDPRLVQEVRRLVTAGDRGALLEYITAPPPDELAEAAKWFSKGGRTILTKDLDWRLDGVTSDEMRIRLFVRPLVILAVDPPATAAKALPWSDMESNRTNQVLTLLDTLVAKGEEWCRRFVAAAISRNAKAGQATAVSVIRYCLPLILHFGIDAADFEAYPRLWAFYYRDLVGGRIHDACNIGPAGTAVVFPKMQKSLLELWDQDATAAKTFLRCFEVPDALGPLTRKQTQKEWTVGAAVRGYFERGTLSREEVFGKVRTALARGDGLPTQRVLADVLKSCQPSPEQVAASIPLLLSTVAIASGFLSFLAFGLLLQAPLDGGDLRDLSNAVFGRTEKKPQELLVRHLKSLQASRSYDAAVLAACWEAAAGSSDLLIRTSAKEMVGRPLTSIREESLSATSLWGTGVRQPPQIPRYVAFKADPTKALPSGLGQREHSIGEEQHVDRFLRTVHRVPQFVRDWYRRRYAGDVGQFSANAEPPTGWRRWADPGPEVAQAMWASGEHDLAAHRNLTGLFRASLSRPFDRDDPFHASSPLAAIHTFRLSELTVQAGTVRYSLATPSYDNFRVEVDRLVSLLRLFEREGWAYGEADLFQALLRLGPLDAQLAAGVPELPVRPLDDSGGQERLAGRILREWVGGGGFKPPPVDAPLTLPVPLERFPSIPPELLSAEMWNGSGRGHLSSWHACEASAVVPFWPDLGAIWSSRGVVYGELVALEADGLAGATAGELGQLGHDWYIALLASPRQEDRGRAVETVLELAARRRLSAENLAVAARKRVEADDQSLGRLVRTLALVAYEGHLDLVLPVLTALVVASSEQQRLPAGTTELLATCTEFWEFIPADHRTTATAADFTAAVLKLAGTKPATKAGLEAKRLAVRLGLVL